MDELLDRRVEAYIAPQIVALKAELADHRQEFQKCLSESKAYTQQLEASILVLKDTISNVMDSVSKFMKEMGCRDHLRHTTMEAVDAQQTPPDVPQRSRDSWATQGVKNNQLTSLNAIRKTTAAKFAKAGPSAHGGPLGKPLDDTSDDGCQGGSHATTQYKPQHGTTNLEPRLERHSNVFLDGSAHQPFHTNFIHWKFYTEFFVNDRSEHFFCRIGLCKKTYKSFAAFRFHASRDHLTSVPPGKSGPKPSKVKCTFKNPVDDHPKEASNDEATEEEEVDEEELKLRQRWEQIGVQTWLKKQDRAARERMLNEQRLEAISNRLNRAREKTEELQAKMAKRKQHPNNDQHEPSEKKMNVNTGDNALPSFYQ